MVLTIMTAYEADLCLTYTVEDYSVDVLIVGTLTNYALMPCQIFSVVFDLMN